MFDEPYRTVSASAIEQWIRVQIAEFVHVDVNAIATHERFESFGIDSAKAIALMMELHEWLRFPDEIPVELLFEAESINHASQGIFAVISDFVRRNQQSGTLA
jgi:acyl carrier protein